MASRFEISSNSELHHFDCVHAKLSDGVIGHVLPRGRAGVRHVSSGVILQNPPKRAPRLSSTSVRAATPPRCLPNHRTITRRSRGEATTELLSGYSADSAYSLRLPSQASTTPLFSESMSMSTTTKRSTLKRLQDDADKANNSETKKSKRREQCRANQARYRDRKRAEQRRTQRSVQQLQEELQGLMLKHRCLRYGERTGHSQWSIVNNVFRLIETSFRAPWRMANAHEMMQHAETRQILSALQKSFTHDAGMGDLNGVEVLLEQLRRYSLYCGDPHFQLKRVEELVPRVVKASAQFSVTVTEFTLRSVFPHLEIPIDKEVADKHASLREKLLGQRLDLSCTMTFMMDKTTGRVARLETSVDWVKLLLRILGSVQSVVDVLSQALLTQNCVVGDLTDYK